MYFALGALSAGLLALLALPAFWARAVRLSRRRLELIAPMSMDEIVADNDLMRAEFAAERRRIEQRIEKQTENRAHDRAELGRRAAEIAGLETTLGALQSVHGALQSEHARLQADHLDACGERAALAVELYDSSGMLARLRDEYAELNRAHGLLEDLADERAITVAALDARAQSLQLRGETYAQENEELQRDLRLQEERARGLGEERDMLLKDLHGYEQRMVAAQARLEAEQMRAAGLQQKIDDARARMERAETVRREADEALRESVRARELGDARIAALGAQLDEARASLRAAERAGADRVEALRAEVAALKGALAAAREARGANGETAQLRAALAELGEKVAQIAQQPRHPA